MVHRRCKLIRNLPRPNPSRPLIPSTLVVKKTRGAPNLSISTLVLRLVTLLALAASIVLLDKVVVDVLLDKVTLNDGNQTTFKDIIAYRYVMATAAVGSTYTLIQLPFAMHYVCTQKRLIRNQCLPEFDFYADKVIAFLLANGAAAGFAATLELKTQTRELLKFFEAFGDTNGFQSEVDKFFNKAYIAVGLVFVGFICLALLSVISSLMKFNSIKTTTCWVYLTSVVKDVGDLYIG